MQNKLSQMQVDAFNHDEFVEDQADHFMELLGADAGGAALVLDVGGGRGFFARHLMQRTSFKVRVMDTDAASVADCHARGIDAETGDALSPRFQGDEDIVCFNLILHHLVASSEAATRELQCNSLAVWRRRVRAVFVNEYIYESYVRGFSGWLIYQITKNRALSWLGRAVSVILPSLRANTFGVGVRFRDRQQWRQIFEEAGYDVAAVEIGTDEHISLPRRLLFIRRIGRDSFLLRPRP